MKISIDGVDYQVPAEEEFILLSQIQKMALGEYAKLDSRWRLLGKPLAREWLRRSEDEARAKWGKEQALVFRPDKHADPCIHLSKILLRILQEALKHVEVSIGTDGHTVAALSLAIEGKGADGRPLVIDGHIGIGENDRTQIP